MGQTTQKQENVTEKQHDIQRSVEFRFVLSLFDKSDYHVKRVCDIINN